MAPSMLKGYRLLLYFLSLLASFFVGVSFAGIVGAGENQGLAAAAIVIGYGVVAAFIGLILSLFMAGRLSKKQITRLNLILGLVILSFYAYYHISYLERQRQREKVDQELHKKKPTTAPSNELSLFPNLVRSSHSTEKTSSYGSRKGLGLFSPNLFDQEVLHFYGRPNFDKAIKEHLPFDSMSFGPLEHGGYDITAAPPWLVPEHMKLDYDMLYFKVISISEDFIEIETNKHTNQSSYVSRSSGRLIYWPEFLLKVNSVELINSETQSIYVKPLDHAGRVNQDYDFMRPISVRGNWMLVRLVNESYENVGEGWIKWSKEGELLIQYSILS